MRDEGDIKWFLGIGVPYVETGPALLKFGLRWPNFVDSQLLRQAQKSRDLRLHIGFQPDLRETTLFQSLSECRMRHV